MKDKLTSYQCKESWQPPPHVAPDSFKNRILFTLRFIFDLQVATTYRDVKRALKDVKNDILEIGCGLQPYRYLIPKHIKYYAIDWKDSSVFSYHKAKDVIYYNGKIFPFKTEVFDFIFHTEVLEHIYDLNLFLSECYRVALKNGKMFFTIPFAARYHYIPHDYWRLTPASIEKLLKSAGFRNIVITNKGSDVTVAISKLNIIFYRIIFKKYDYYILKIINVLFFGGLFIAPIIFLTITGHLSILLRIGSPDDPLGYSVYCEK